MVEENQSPGRKWPRLENDGDGNTYFDNFRFTPFSTDLAFFRDPIIYETELPRATLDRSANPGSSSGDQRSKEQRKEETREPLARP